jgi:DNA polymerase-3 subunit epsilon
MVMKLLGEMTALVTGVLAPASRIKALAAPPPRERIIAIDCETTGLHPEAGDRMVTLALVEAAPDMRPSRSRYLIFNPERRSHSAAERVHGFDAWTLKHQDCFDAHAPSIADFISGARLVGHNVGFDIRFLRMEFERARRVPPPFSSACTMEMAQARFGRRMSLDALLDLHGVTASVTGRDQRHSALGDAAIALGLYGMMTRGEVVMQVLQGEPDNWQAPPLLPAHHDMTQRAKMMRAASLTPAMAKEALDFYGTAKIAAASLGVTQKVLLARLAALDASRGSER